MAANPVPIRPDPAAVTALKRRVDLLQLVPGLTRIASTGGGEYAGPCPICKDGEDRFHAQPHRPDGGIWMCRHCTDGQWKDVIAFVMRRNNCSFPQAVQRLGGDPLSQNGHKAPDQPPGKQERGPVVARYDYPDEAGTVLFQVWRHDPKTFSQHRPDGRGGWIAGLGETRRVLYNLPALVNADPAVPVWIVEGERDVETLTGWGLLATCNPGGVGMGWKPEYSAALTGRTVYLIPDQDEAGAKHAAKVRAGVAPVAARCTVVRLPESCKDVSDYAAAGHTRADLEALSRTIPDVDAVMLADVQPEHVAWLWPGRIPLGKLTILDGDPGLGKSILSLDLAARVSRGAALPDGSLSECDGPAGVLLLSAEDGLADTIRPRLDAAGADCTRIVALQTVGSGDAERMPTLADLDILEALIRAHAIRLLVVDPLMAYLPSTTNAHQDQDVRRALAPLARMAETTGCAVLVVRHLNKAAGGNPLYRGGGSIGIIGAARSGLMVAADPDDVTGLRRVLVGTKANLAPPAAALAYHLDSEGTAVRIVYEGVTSHTALSLLDGPADEEERGSRNEAGDFLKDALAEGPRPASELFTAARSEGIGEKALKRAKHRLGVIAQKEGYNPSRWMWSLPDPLRCKPEESRRGPVAEQGPLRPPSTPFDGEVTPFDSSEYIYYNNIVNAEEEGNTEEGRRGPLLSEEGRRGSPEKTQNEVTPFGANCPACGAAHDDADPIRACKACGAFPDDGTGALDMFRYCYKCKRQDYGWTRGDGYLVHQHT